MYNKEGFGSLYRGVALNTVAGSIANSIFFYVYDEGKTRYNYDPKKPYSLTTILISYRAGLVAMFITTPMWTLKTRMALFQEYNNKTTNSMTILMQICRDMLYKEGP